MPPATTAQNEIPALRHVRSELYRFRAHETAKVIRALTALGIAIAITTLVTTVGLLDTFGATLDRAEHETLHAAPDRASVALDTGEQEQRGFSDSTVRWCGRLRRCPRRARWRLD